MQVHNLTDESAAAFRTGNPGKLFGVNMYNGAAVQITVREGSATGRILMVVELAAAGIVTEILGESNGVEFGSSGLWVNIESGAASSMLLQVYAV